QTTFSFVSHRVRFSPTSVYTKMLIDSSHQTVAICDASAQRSWLVPKLSLLIYMAHVWATNSGLGHSIPFADPHDNGKALADQFLDKGDLVLCGHNDDTFRLRSLLLGFNINLLATIGTTEKKSAGKHIYGVELLDVVTEPGRGAVMKKIKLGRCGNWIPIANIVDAILVCSDLGQAIVPTSSAPPHASCPICSFAPTGRDYLVAHLSCLESLTHRSNIQRFGVSPHPSLMSLPNHHVWKLSGRPF
ncbi:hypothetical protein CC80DRAFT_410122, partial [Byssothecium circinans]